MKKNTFVLAEMGRILASLTRGLDLDVLSRGFGEERGVPISFQAESPVLGLVLPSNSPGRAHAVAAGHPDADRPGPQAGPAGAVDAVPHGRGVLPGGHSARSDLDLSGRRRRRRRRARGLRAQPDLRRHGRRSIATAAIPRVQAHGPGFSKILLGDDQVDHWEKYLDVMVDSVFANSGRGCINCSGIWASRHGREIADAIAKRLASVRPLPPDDPEASLAAFTVPGAADVDLPGHRRRPAGARASST